MDTAAYVLRTLLVASVTTVAITAGALVVALGFGLAITAARLAGGRLGKYAVVAYVEMFRNTPVLVQLFIIYFGLGQIGLRLPSLAAAILGLGLNGAALLSEVFRSSMAAIDRGQREAALAVGMTPRRSMVSIIFPQAMRIALPSIGNYVIALMKETSLASAVAAPELSFRAKNLVSETFLSTSIYLTVAAIYLLLSLPVTRLVASLERRMGRSRHG